MSASDFYPQSVTNRDLQGRVCVVTGANSGLGLQTALDFARRGATLLMLSRSKDKGTDAVAKIRLESGNNDVSLHICDVSSLDSIRAFASEIERAKRPIHVLVNNAGVMLDKRATSADGYEMNFATNTLGSFAVARLLMPALERAQGRVIFVSSGGMLTEALETKDLQSEGLKPFDGTKIYARNKRQQVALCEEFARRYGSKGVGFYSMHPGWVDTPGLQSSMPSFYRQFEKQLRTLPQGTDTISYLALEDSSKLESGAFYFDRRPARKHLWLSGTGYSQNDVESLWSQLEEMCGAREGGGGGTGSE